MTQDKLIGDSDSWRDHVIDDGEGLTRILGQMQRIAVIGIKTQEDGGPAHYIPAQLQELGFEVVPVPVYYPEATEILGQPVHRSLQSIDPPADLVLLFRRSHDVPAHADELLAAAPGVVWMQQGIRNAEVAERLARAGIDVVQDRCIATELRLRR